MISNSVLASPEVPSVQTHNEEIKKVCKNVLFCVNPHPSTVFYLQCFYMIVAGGIIVILINFKLSSLPLPAQPLATAPFRGMWPHSVDHYNPS